jgi:arylsulfatase A-like enzyme
METTTEEFLGFAAEHEKRPIFGYLCYMDVNQAFYDQLAHSSWTPEPPIESGVSAYEAALRRLDAEIERLLLVLEKRGRLANTIIVVTSDHGESFGEPLDHDPQGHGTSLYPEQVRVPLVVIAPGRVPVGTRVAHAVSLTDLAGYLTLLAVGGDPLIPGHNLLTTTEPDAPRGLFLTLDYSDYSARSIVTDNLQYIWNRKNKSTPEEVFDLATDSLARQSIAASHPDLAAFRALVHRADPAAGANALR